jgi:hypothetical protein
MFFASPKAEYRIVILSQADVGWLLLPDKLKQTLSAREIANSDSQYGIEATVGGGSVSNRPLAEPRRAISPPPPVCAKV